MNKLSRFHSLSIQLLGGVLVSFMAALLSFILLYTLGMTILDNTFYGDAFSKKMSDRQFGKLQEYVTNESITSDSLHRLNGWFVHKEAVYLTLYRDGKLIYESPTAMSSYVDYEEYDPSFENAEREYLLVFGDGAKAQAFVYYYASDAFFYLMTAVSVIFSSAVFSLCLIALIHRKMQYIQKLKAELDFMAGGDLSRPVTVLGKDELSELADGIDKMRQSILAHQRAEDEIRSANSQLVTAMSHDLRTPLTSLLAYLEILDREKAENEEQRRHLISQSLGKAATIKAMADKLFEYFLVYTSEWEQPETERLNADDVFGQFWQEYAFALESNGFTVKTDFGILEGFVTINTELMRRAFDNLYSNLIKYADPSREITISYMRENEQVVLRIENVISAQRDRRESTNIGLNTCDRILRMHNGSFDCREEKDVFSVTLSLPLET